MKTRFRFLALFMVPALAVGLSTLLVACGGDEDGEEEVDAVLKTVTPESGSVPKGSIISLVFDKDPGTTLTASGGTLGGAGTNRTVTADAETITLTWGKAGSKTLTYTLTAADTTAPSLTSSSPADGAADVDPTTANTDGIVLEFDEDITKATLEVQSGGVKIGAWTATRDGGKVTLNPAGGAELVNETEYAVVGTVEDAAGNETEIDISFTTKAKE